MVCRVWSDVGLYVVGYRHHLLFPGDTLDHLQFDCHPNRAIRHCTPYKTTLTAGTGTIPPLADGWKKFGKRKKWLLLEWIIFEYPRRGDVRYEGEKKVHIYSALICYMCILLLLVEGSSQQIICLHLTLSLVFPSVTQPLNVLLPYFILPGSSIFRILCPLYPLSLLSTCPNHLSLLL